MTDGTFSVLVMGVVSPPLLTGTGVLDWALKSMKDRFYIRFKPGEGFERKQPSDCIKYICFIMV